MTTFGEVSWNDSFSGDKKQNNNKDLWLRLEEGSNEMRLVTAPFQYLVHRYKKEGDAGFGQKVSCSAIHGSCPLCDLGDKAKPRWLLGVITRKPGAGQGTYKILDVSYMVFSAIRKLAQNTQRWGDPTKYDIDIVVDKNGGATGYYSVQPVSKEPLSASDQKIKDEVDLDELKRKVTPPTPEFVQKRLDKINGVASDFKSQAKPVSKPVQAKPAPAVVDMAEDESMDDMFPAHDGQ
jgi:hypothetical protein